MSDKELQKIADNANFIVSGYAFTEREDGFVSILILIILNALWLFLKLVSCLKQIWMV